MVKIISWGGGTCKPPAKQCQRITSNFNYIFQHVQSGSSLNQSAAISNFIQATSRQSQHIPGKLSFARLGFFGFLVWSSS